MGCDIHIVLERKYKDKWVGVLQPVYLQVSGSHALRDYRDPSDMEERARNTSIVRAPCCDRHYSFFAALAGVRGKGPSPRGIPKDASDLALMKIEDDGSDGHSHSYYGLPEFLQLAIKHSPGIAKWAGNRRFKSNDNSQQVLVDLCYWYIGYFIHDTSDWPRFEDFRVVFWFDN